MQGHSVADGGRLLGGRGLAGLSRWDEHANHLESQDEPLESTQACAVAEAWEVFAELSEGFRRG